MITDGVKDGSDGRYVELNPGAQWVQIDLGVDAELFGIWFWHFHKNPRAYVDVIVQVSRDPAFPPQSTRTLFNADHDNTLGFELGRDWAYVDTNLGRVVDAHGLKARYVRLWSNGNTQNEMNHPHSFINRGKNPKKIVAGAFGIRLI